MSKQKNNTKRSKVAKILLITIIAVLGVWIASYYVNLIGETRAEGGNPTEEKFVHPDISEIIADKPFPAEGQYCLACHQGIEPARPIGSKMMQQILEQGKKLGDPNGCVVCHGGTPSELKNKDKAHSGVSKGSLLAAFTPVPAALQVNDNTCGQCHKDHVYNVRLSMMNSDAGKR